MSTIREFQGQYRFLSNFWRAEVAYEGNIYPTVEHAYQAAKSLDPKFRAKVLLCETPGRAKRIGKQAILRSNWNREKYSIMHQLVYQKFKNNPDLQKKLLDTRDDVLQEGNEWGDTYWGIDLKTFTGENNLGKILMLVRKELKERNS